MFLSVSLGGINHHSYVFKLRINRTLTTGGQKETPVFPHLIDQSLAVVSNILRCSKSEQVGTDVAADAHVAAKDLLGPEDIRGSVQVCHALAFREFPKVGQVQAPVRIEMKPRRDALGNKGIHKPL